MLFCFVKFKTRQGLFLTFTIRKGRIRAGKRWWLFAGGEKHTKPAMVEARSDKAGTGSVRMCGDMLQPAMQSVRGPVPRRLTDRVRRQLPHHRSSARPGRYVSQAPSTLEREREREDHRGSCNDTWPDTERTSPTPESSSLLQAVTPRTLISK